MLKRFMIASVTLFALCAQALAAGSISLSLSQQFDSQGRPLAGGLLYFFAAGTTTPQSAFQDSGLSIAYPNPIELDASGRVPAFYLADGAIKIRLTDSSGVTVITADNLLVVGASSGGGGGGSVDATTVLATGDVKARFGTGTLSGFVRMNGRTIGSASSGATERANADGQTLFEYLWNTVDDSNLPVSGGRGASANADWLANKTITLPDLRGRVIAGMDDMGNTAAGRLNSFGLGNSATNLGGNGGAQLFTLTSTQLPAHTHNTAVSLSGTTGGESNSHTHSLTVSGSATTSTDGAHTHSFTQPSGTFTAGAGGLTGSSTTSGTTSSDGSHSHSVTVNSSGTSGVDNAGHTHNWSGADTFTSTSAGSGTAFSVVQPTYVMTYYLKL